MSMMKPIRYAPILMLAFLASGCTSIKEGEVVAKGSSLATTGAQPRPMYWVEVRGLNADGASVTERVNLFEWDWNAMTLGAHIAPADYGLGAFARTVAKAVEPESPEPVPPPRKPKSKHAHGGKAARLAQRKPAAAPIPKTGPAPSATTTAQRAERFREVEAKAIEDPSVRELKQKIHVGGTDEEQGQALRNYRKGVFDKMRALDSSLHDMIDQAEAGGSKNPAPQ